MRRMPIYVVTGLASQYCRWYLYGSASNVSYSEEIIKTAALLAQCQLQQSLKTNSVAGVLSTDSRTDAVAVEVPFRRTPRVYRHLATTLQE